MFQFTTAAAILFALAAYADAGPFSRARQQNDRSDPILAQVSEIPQTATVPGSERVPGSSPSFRGADTLASALQQTTQQCGASGGRCGTGGQSGCGSGSCGGERRGIFRRK